MKSLHITHPIKVCLLTHSTSSRSNQLDKQGFVPLYFQIQQSLLERIHRGELKEGDLLESEEELSRRFHVSRMTARQALQGLKLQGYAMSERGRGTFVTKPKFEKSILMLEGFTEEIRKRGDKPSSRLLLQEVTDLSDEVAAKLQISATEKALHLQRLRLVNNVPLAVEDSHIVLRRFPGIEKVDFSKHSLYETIRTRYGMQFGWADEIIEAVPATKFEAELLSIPRRSSLLWISRTLMSADNSPIEYAVSRYRGDRYHASLRINTSVVGDKS